MNKKINKKSQIFTIGLIIISMSAIIYGVLFLGMNKSAFETEPIGKKAFEIVETSHKSETALLFVDYSARNSAWNAICSMAEKGGISPVSFNGEYLGYNLWKKDRSKNTFGPFDYKSNFLNQTRKNLNKFLEINPLLKDTLTPYYSAPIDYYLTVKNKQLIGSPDQNYYLRKDMISNIQGEKTTIGTIEYAFNPSFNININYDIDEYREISDSAQNLLEKCKNSNKTLNCINKNKPASWIIGDCDSNIHNSTGTKFRFCVPSKYRIICSKDNKIQTTNIKYKFALDFLESLT